MANQQCLMGLGPSGDKGCYERNSYRSPEVPDRLVIPVASAIASFGSVATENVVIGTNMEGMAKPLITIGQMTL